ncbi:MAG: hypothetical protein R3D00_21210 [Bacteroidia bacterium]
MKNWVKTLSLSVCMIFLTTGQPFTAYAGQVGSRDSSNVIISEEGPVEPIVSKSSETLIKESTVFGIAAMITSAVVPLVFFLSFFGVATIFILGLIAWPISILLSVIGIIKVIKARRMMSSFWAKYDEEKWKKSNRALIFNSIALALAAIYPIALMIYAATIDS